MGIASWRITSSGSTISFVENSTTRLSVTAPGLIASARKLLIHWAVRADGTSNQSDVLLYNYATGGYAFGTVRHVVYSPLATF